MDALRHIVGSYDLTRLPDRFCAQLSMDDSDFRVVVYEKREKLDAITTALRTRLERLAVVPMPRSQPASWLSRQIPYIKQRLTA